MLQKSTITIPLGLGVNSKVDPKLVEQGKFNLVSENVSFDKIGTVKKRQSYKELPSTYYEVPSSFGSGTGILPDLTYPPTCVAGLGNSAILRNKRGQYFYLHEDELITNVDLLPESKIDSKIIYSPRVSIDSTDSIYDPNENMIAITGRDGIEGLASVMGSPLILYSLDTGTSIEAIYTMSSSGAGRMGFPRVSFTRVSDVSYYYHAAIDSAQIMTISVFSKYGQSVAQSTYTNILSDGVTTTLKGPIASCVSTNQQTSYFIVPTNTAGQGRFIAWSAGTQAINVTFSMTGTGWDSSSAKFQGGVVYLCYVTTSGQARQIVFNPDGTVNVADTNLTNATGCLSVSYDQDTSLVVHINDADGASVWAGGTKKAMNQGTRLVTDKVTLDAFDTIMCVDNLGQNTYFSIPGEFNNSENRFGYNVRARLTNGNGKGYSPLISRSSKVSQDVCYVALPILISGDGLNLNASSWGIQLVKIEATQDYKSNSRAIIGKNLHFSGGYLSEFDSGMMFENGFHLRPVKPNVVVSPPGEGVLNGSYSYVICLKWVDKNGQVTRSEPSDITTVSVVNGFTRSFVTKCPFGKKMANVVIELYRTATGGSTFYFVKESTSDFFTPGTSVLTDNVPDSEITSNQILYTSGGVLANNPAPACKSVFQGGNRVYCVGLEDENEIAYSKKKLFGECANFSDFLRIRLDTSQFNIQGGITSGGYMDDKIILFKDNSIFYIAGDGPNELGSSDTFTQPQLISSDTGCTEPRSVVLTPKGLMFKGKKGIYLLDRGLNVSYIGAPVEEFNSVNITSAVHVDQKNEIVFTLANTEKQLTLTYNYYSDQWSSAVNFYGVDGDLLGSDHVIMDLTSSIPQKQNGSDFQDNISTYSLRVVTPWIKVSGIQDFSRMWSATILGKYKSHHDLIVKARYDYDENYVETFTFYPKETDKQYQYRCHLRKQKCEAVQFEIYDSSITGESMELTALTIESGLKNGSMKLASSRKA